MASPRVGSSEARKLEGRPRHRRTRVDRVSARLSRAGVAGAVGRRAELQLRLAAVVASAIPRIGFTLLLGIGLGAAWSAFLIYRRYRNGGMPSSGQRPGANVVLSIDDPIAPRLDAAADNDRRSSRGYASARGGSVALSAR